MRRRDRQAHWYYAGDIFPPPRRAGRRLARAVADGRAAIAEHWRASLMAMALVTAAFALFLLGNRPPDVGSSVSALHDAASSTSLTPPVSTSIPPNAAKGTSTNPAAGSRAALPDSAGPGLSGSYPAKSESKTATTTKSVVLAPPPSTVAAAAGPTVVAVSVSPPTTAPTWPASTTTTPPPTTTTTTTEAVPPPTTTTLPPTTTTDGP